MNADDVTPNILLRLTGHALVAFLASAEKFEVEAGPGIWKVISGEPVADLNYLMITAATPAAIESFQRHVADLDRRELPFACMVASEVADALKPVCSGAGLVHATDWPLMVCPASAVEAHVKEGVSVHRVETEQDATDSARLLSEAFHMPLDSVRRVVPLAMAQLPGIEVQLARVGDRACSTVTVTRHDQVVGIWGMGTPPEEQGKGLGKVLLSQVMEEHRRRGAEAFFLGATPAGQPLYEKLGYRTVATAQVWVRGETHQA